jgi:ABC-type Zn uptake system ZnuABC Zn-binding protein ZnuA
MKRRTAVALLLGIGLAALGVTGCAPAVDPWEAERGTPRIVVTIAPLYSFVKAVAGKDAAVQCLCTTTGPHHFQVDTRDARMLRKADAFFAVGLKLDDRFADALVTLSRRKDLPYVKLGDGLKKDLLLDMRHEEGHEGHDDDHGKHDPHVWLGIPQAVEMVRQIQETLAKADEKNAEQYRKNADAFVAVLKEIKKDGNAKLEGKKVKRIVSFHEALGYFARTFGLEIADVIEEGPGDEPTQKHLAELKELCKNKEKPIGAITVEPQYPKSSSAAVVQQSLKREKIDIPLVEVDPLETAEVAELRKEGAGWYEARMRENVKALAAALK